MSVSWITVFADRAQSAGGGAQVVFSWGTTICGLFVMKCRRDEQIAE